jgi:cob(I)alamin adenosyltransferase
MAVGRERLPVAASAHFAREVERLAERAVTRGKADEVAHAVRLCELKAKLSLTVQQHCQAADTVLAKLAR